MGMIRYVVGDATDPQADAPVIIAHVCNDIGKWGRGFVLAVSQRWSEPEQEYLRWYRDHQAGRHGFMPFQLGEVATVEVAENIWVANMIGQHGIRSPLNRRPIDYAALYQCLDQLSDVAAALHAEVHMPRIGCGLAGGRWDRVEPLIQENLCEMGIPVTVYDLGQ